MSKQQSSSYKRRPSKRQRKVRIAVYIMIIAMVLSTITAGLALFI